MNAPQKISTIVNPLEGMLGYELRRTAAATQLSLAAELESTGLPPGEAQTLAMIGANPGCTQSEICRVTRAQPANMVPLVNKLVQMGALERVPGPGRTLALHLTEQGKKLYADVRAALDRHEAQIAGHLSEAERDEMIATMRSMILASCRGRHDKDC